MAALLRESQATDGPPCLSAYVLAWPAGRDMWRALVRGGNTIGCHTIQALQAAAQRVQQTPADVAVSSGRNAVKTQLHSCLDEQFKALALHVCEPAALC
jgi:hypothetical protein